MEFIIANKVIIIVVCIFAVMCAFMFFISPTSKK